MRLSGLTTRSHGSFQSTGLHHAQHLPRNGRIHSQPSKCNTPGEAIIQLAAITHIPQYIMRAACIRHEQFPAAAATAQQAG